VRAQQLGFRGMTDVEVIRVEGTALGPQAAEQALAGAPHCHIELPQNAPGMRQRRNLYSE
jgi:hypothetical protein